MNDVEGALEPRLTIGSEQLALLEQLSNTIGVSGHEDAVRSLVIEKIRSRVDDLQVDTMGNVLAACRGTTAERVKVMLAAHMDEVGFIITADEGGGLYRIERVGGLVTNWLAGKVVSVGRETLPGFIGTVPIHLLDESDRGRAVSMKQLRVNLGAQGAGRVSLGEVGTYATRFKVSSNTIFGKALDDRLGVATLIELINHAPANIDLLAAFTVQEELGLRGAGIAAYKMTPDLAIAVDSTPAYDLPVWDGSENTRWNSRLDDGPAIYVADRGTISDPRLVRHLVQAAEATGLPYQLRQPGGGGTDAGAIHRQRDGIPSVSVSVPGRYAHTPVMVARISDWQATVNLLYLALQRMDRTILDRSDDDYR
ncbi:MAG: M20/M25/M40 family metallo-hydrolase [Anaerolineae bacterium]|nr:M20/M25/M40 family metallo-hydrolase [Anaerolineae bacterium]